MSANKIKLIKIIFPLTIVSMFLVTKWWFVLPIDGPDKLCWGFPLAFMSEGFHTSMSYLFFMLEFFADFAIYFFGWMLLFLIVLKFDPTFNIHKIIAKIIWSLASIFMIVFSLYISDSNPMFQARRDYDWTVMKTGFVFILQSTPQPDINQYHPSKNKDFKNN